MEVDDTDIAAIAFAIRAIAEKAYVIELNRIPICENSFHRKDLVLYKITYPENICEMAVVETMKGDSLHFSIVDFSLPVRIWEVRGSTALYSNRINLSIFLEQREVLKSRIHCEFVVA